jgi:hypothetical protein
MHDQSPLLPTVLNHYTIVLTRGREGWTVTLDGDGAVRRELLAGAGAEPAAREAWASAIRWRAHLLIQDGTTVLCYLTPEQVVAAAQHAYGTIPSPPRAPGLGAPAAAPARTTPAAPSVIAPFHDAPD